MPRAANGEGDKPKLQKNGLWRTRVSYTAADGSTKRHPIYGKTSPECVRKKQEFLTKVRAGKLPTGEGAGQTVGDFITYWLREVARPSLERSTYATYETHSRVHIVAELGRTRLDRLTQQQVQKFVNDLTGDGLAPRTVWDIRAVLRTALNHAVELELIQRNPAEHVRCPRLARGEVKHLERGEVQAMFEALRGDRLEALFLLAVATGLRRGELLGLRWRDVDLDRGMIRINQTIQRVQGEIRVGGPKTERSRRTIYLPEVAKVALREHRVRQNRERLMAGSAWQDHDYVFPNRRGGAMDPRNLKRVLDRALERAGLPHVTVHGLRHTTTAILIDEGADAKLISEMLGHTRISTTMDIYGQLFSDTKRQTAHKMDNALLGGPRTSERETS